jgi:hypothetical protein
MTDGLTIECRFNVRKHKRGRKVLEVGGDEPAAPPAADPQPGRIPRITRLMALAIRCERLIREGQIADYAEVARLGHVTRARVSQIMNLLHLAPDIQEEILFLPPITGGRDTVCLRMLQPITAVPNWRLQREAWRQMLRNVSPRPTITC